jgi:hypothetical protein
MEVREVRTGDIYKCIDEEDEKYGKYCVIKDIDNNPDFNGEQTIVLLYSDRSLSYPKTRRIILGITHKFVRRLINEKSMVSCHTR